MSLGLNAGCGKLPCAPGIISDWIQFDMHAWWVHLNGDVRHLPFRNECFDQVHCSHVIEHVEPDEVGMVLAEFKRVLKPSGYLFIAAPDVPRAKEAGSEWWSIVGDVGARLPGWEHRWSCSVYRLRSFLEANGFVPTWARSIPTGHPVKTNGWPDDFEARFLARPTGFRWSRYYPSAIAQVAIADVP